MKDGVMINAQAYHDTSFSNLLLTEKCSTGLSFARVTHLKHQLVTRNPGDLSGGLRVIN